MLRASTPEASGTQTSKSDTRMDSSLSTCDKYSHVRMGGTPLISGPNIERAKKRAKELHVRFRQDNGE